MGNRSLRSILLKLVLFWVLFLVLHFIYDWLPYPIVAIFSGNSEAVAQHMKISFFAYAFASLIEFAWLRIPKPDRLRFLDSRLLGLLIVTFGTMLWYIVPAIRGVGMPNDLLEILYANLVILLVGLGAVLLERDLARIQFSRASRAALILFNLSLITILILGTFRIPWGGFWYQ